MQLSLSLSCIASGLSLLASAVSHQTVDSDVLVHFVSPLPSVVVGPQMALTSPLIRQMDGNKTFKVWGLTKRVPQNAVKILSSWGTAIATVTSDMNAYFSAALTNNNVVLTVGAMSGNYVGWAITDENDNLYLAQNESPSSAKTLYMGFMHNY